MAKPTEVLAHRNYKRVAENNLEFIRGDIWDLEIPKIGGWPTAVYFPGDDIFLERLKQVTINMNNGASPITKQIFSQELHQNAGRDIQNGSVTLAFLDKEDQAISFMLNDWLNQIGDPETGFGRHKKELNINFTINIYNTLLQKIRYYDCICGILTNADIQDSPTDKGGDLSDVSMTLNFELMKRKIL